MDEKIQALKDRVAQQIQANRQMRLGIGQSAQNALDCANLHKTFTSLSTNMFGWFWRWRDIIHCNYISTDSSPTYHADCSVKTADGHAVLWDTAERVKRCMFSAGSAAECSDPHAPWVGAFVFGVVALACMFIIWYCATTCSQTLRFHNAVADVSRHTAAGARLAGRRQRAVTQQRKFWIVMKCGIAVALWILFMCFVISVSSTLTWVVNFFIPVHDNSRTTPSLLEAVWSGIFSAPQRIVGASLDRIMMLYSLAAIVLPLFLFISKCMRSAAADANGIVPQVRYPQGAAHVQHAAAAVPQHPLLH
jgi:hypothetical protein